KELPQCGWPVRLEGGAGIVECFAVDAFRIVDCLKEIGVERADQHSLPQPFGAVFAYVSRDLAGAHGVSDERDPVEVQRAQKSLEVGCKGIVVVADGGLTRPAEAAAVICDYAMASGEERFSHASPLRGQPWMSTIGEPEP